jgi:hypothetical protein
MIINFRVYKINQDIHKFSRILDKLKIILQKLTHRDDSIIKLKERARVLCPILYK